MFPQKLSEAINRQIHQELQSAYHYLAMAAHFQNEGLDGFAHWMEMQHGEEMQHAMRLFRYVHRRGSQVHLAGLEAPKVRQGSPLTVFQQALEMEKANTAAIHELYAIATEVRDYATVSHLKWFLDEQVEEEDSIEQILAHFRIAGNDPSGLLLLNRQLGERQPESEENEEEGD
jgi:ferritin